jgi:integrase
VYRFLSSVFNTAVRNGDVGKNPCQIKGAGKEEAPERTTATLGEVEVIAANMPKRFHCLVLLACWTSLRRGELLGLRRRDIDVVFRNTVTVAQTRQTLKQGRQIVKQPKSRAGLRTVAIPPHIISDIREHLDTYVGPEPDALMFTGEKGGALRPHVLHKHWTHAR